jgi:hypothetical protein
MEELLRQAVATDESVADICDQIDQIRKKRPRY